MDGSFKQTKGQAGGCHMGQSLIRPQQADPDALFCAAAGAGAGAAAVPRCAVCTAARQGARDDTLILARA